MKHTIIKMRNAILAFIYQRILRPIYFRFDAENVHDRALMIGRLFSQSYALKKLTGLFFSYSHPSLKQNILGIEFKNPIGLAAGFDKNADHTQIINYIGFGFEEIGSITGQPCKGNPKPRLWRLPESKSIVVNYGLTNLGADALAQKLARLNFSLPIGINAAMTNSAVTADTQKGIDDYLRVAAAFKNIGDYYTINISCPNTYGGQPFTSPERLDLLLQHWHELNLAKPTLIKLPPCLTKLELNELISIANQYNIAGYICTNLTKDRNSINIAAQEVGKLNSMPGSLSGKPVEHLANETIKHVYQITKGQKVIIGCGGIFTANDAYQKIKLGANLLQLITGMIFQGPQVVSEINQGLVRFLKQDGYHNISEAVGKDNPIT